MSTLISLTEFDESNRNLEEPLLLLERSSDIQEDDNSNDLSQPKSLMTVSSLKARWIILAFSCATMTGSYYSYDTPAALHQQIKNYMPDDVNFEIHFNLLYSIYSIPNIILPILGGKLSDNYGASFSLMSFCAIALCGQLFFAFGLYNQQWSYMFLGRAIYGLGGESITVASSAILSTWFGNGKELALAFGINLAVSRLGSVLNDVLSPTIANATNSAPMALIAATGINALSFLSSMVVFFIDRQSTRKIQQQNQVRYHLTEALLEVPNVSENDANKKEDHVHYFSNFGFMFWLLCLSCVVVYGCVLPFNNIASGILLERNYFQTSTDPNCILLHPDQCTSGILVSSPNPSTSLVDGSSCPGPFVAPLLPSSLNISWAERTYIFNPLNESNVDCDDIFWAQACTQNYCKAQKVATELAGRRMAIPYIISAVFSPILGHMVDTIGCRAIIIAIAPFLLVLVHGDLALRKGSPIIPLLFQGVAYSLYAAVIWPSIPLTVKPSFTGSAYGTITSFQNLGLALFPLLIAEIYKRHDNLYIPYVELFFVSLATFGVCIGLSIHMMDQRTGGKLNFASATVVREETGTN